MDFPDATTEPDRPWWRRPAALLVAAALALYCILLVEDIGAVAGGSDSSGYLNHARLLSQGRVHLPERAIPGLPPASAPSYLYVPLGFRPARDGDGLVPTYPSGLALFIVALKPVAGWRHAGDLVIILHSIAGLVATYAVCRILGLGRPWALLGAALVAASPLYLFMSLQAMSDVPSLFWTAAAILAAVRSRERPGWAVAAGAAVAVDVLLRPANLLVVVPLAAVLGMSPRRWILFLAGGVPGALYFAAHSHAAYGSYLATGYGDATRSFQAAFVPGTLAHYARWLPALFTPVVVLALALPWARGVPPWVRWLLCLWIIPFAAFYSAYLCTHEAWWYLRFLLPIAPALVAGALLVLRAILSHAPAGGDPGRSAAALAAALALVALFSGWWIHRLNVLNIGREELRYGHVARWMQANVPHDAVCLSMQASGALLYYTDFTIMRWDMLNRANAGGVEAAIRAAHRPLYAVLFPFELDDSGALSRHMPGDWKQVGRVDAVTIWRRDLDGRKP